MRRSHDAKPEVSREPGVLESAVLRKLGIPELSELSDDLSDEGLKDKELLSWKSDIIWQIMGVQQYLCM